MKQWDYIVQTVIVIFTILWLFLGIAGVYVVCL